ncbi:putative RNA SFII helicase Spb4p [Cryptosporidium canis]|uniref:ATP-dependent RNA helicase n=1 Tax=Cryptosporidium canis TaxID=195482 RepID=A0ABQ8P2X8_9CRYT|nr:putative RNA SFII helicase Spb4p [Cryptosporidium canis]
MAGNERKKQANTRNGAEKTKYRGFEALKPSISGGSLDFIQNHLKFKFMSPVQEVTIPELLTHKDVAVEACTGSGKTMSYLVPVVEILLKSKVRAKGVSNFNMGSLILTPTRELSMQVFDILERYLDTVNLYSERESSKSVLRALMCIGGGNVNKTLEYIKEEAESDSFEGLNKYYILVGTPGRVFHLFENLKDGIDWNIKSTLEILVLDEADRLLDMGFENHINMILHSMPKQRRTGLFSATLNAQVQNLIKTGLRNPKFIKVSIATSQLDRPVSEEKQESSSAEGAECDISVPIGLTCYYVELGPLQKIEFLIRFLIKVKEEISLGRPVKCIVFFLTCNSVEFYFKYLSKLFHSHSTDKQKKLPKNDYSVDSSFGKLCKLHGQMYQRSREKSYEIFKGCDSGVLITTDLTARGIDIPDIEWIIQFDAPQDPSYYIHRIGRTARAGKLGKSVIMLQPQEGAFIEYIEKKTMRRVLSYSHTEEDKVSDSTRHADYNSIDDQFYREHEDLQLCGCINLNKNLMEKDEFLNNEANKYRIGLRTIRVLMFSDFDFYETAKRAFVSYIRAYKEYQLPFIFPFRSLSIGEIAASFALLRIPRVKEILGKSITPGKFITGSKNIHPDDFNPNPKEPVQTPDSNVNKADEHPNKKREPKRSQEESGKGSSSKRSRSEKRAAKRKIELDEWQTLQFENNLAKKLKTGKITYKEYQNRLKQFYQDDEPSKEDEHSGPSTHTSSSDDESSDPEFNHSSNEEKHSGHKANSNGNKQKIPKWVIKGKKNKKKR